MVLSQLATYMHIIVGNNPLWEIHTISNEVVLAASICHADFGLVTDAARTTKLETVLISHRGWFLLLSHDDSY